MSEGISHEEYNELVVEVEAFRFGQAVGNLNRNGRIAERDLKVEQWTKFRDGLPTRELKRKAVLAYRKGYQ